MTKFLGKEIEEVDKAINKLKPSEDCFESTTNMLKEMFNLSIDELMENYSEIDRMGYACSLVEKLQTLKECQEKHNKFVEKLKEEIRDDKEITGNSVHRMKLILDKLSEDLK